MWRTDDLYDVVVVLSYNERPRIKGLGSAIFLHIARADRKPTEGCIAFERRDLLRLIARLPRAAAVRIPG
jgi:L,D-peptidoglycan transpeptidase YkuD (ErfK/YbiS/YcfS/YnhG family)